MENELLQSLINDDFGYRHEGRDWGRSEQHSSLVVNEKEQRWYWNSMGISGGILEYLTLVRKMSKNKAKELIARIGKFSTLPEETLKGDVLPYENLVDLLWNVGKNHREYWYKRCLTDSTIDRNLLGYYEGWSLLPLYEKGRFVNFQCRRDEPSKFIKYWYDNSSFKPTLVNEEILSLVDSIYITEGTVDSLLLTQEGLPSVASTGGSGYWDNNWFSLFSNIENIYYIADNDDSGKWASKKVAESLGTSRVKIFKFDGTDKGYDTVDYYRDGGTTENLKEMLRTNSKYLFETGEFNERKSGRNTKKYNKR